ncbi:MAG: hypothetical protein NT141_01325 [candidate division WWE3 bacterium]|nr:hypothetical protein [candidate division WWE3 bacterium]
METTATPSMKVEVISPESSYTAEVTAVSARNDTGPFDVLPGHANFITEFKGLIKLKLVDHSNWEVNPPYGVLRCRNNQVTIYIPAFKSEDKSSKLPI